MMKYAPFHVELKYNCLQILQMRNQLSAIEDPTSQFNSTQHLRVPHNHKSEVHYSTFSTKDIRHQHASNVTKQSQGKPSHGSLAQASSQTQLRSTNKGHALDVTVSYAT
jgi:hypothetical protein